MSDSAAILILIAGLWLLLSCLAAVVLGPIVAAGESEFRRRCLDDAPPLLRRDQVA